MSWPINDGAKLFLGILGNITALGLFASPVFTFVRIFKNKSTEGFSGIPYVVTLMNCSIWTFYGLPMVTKSAILVTTINAAGTAAEAVYISIFVLYAVPKLKVQTLAQTAAALTFVAAVITLTLTLRHGTDERSQFVGIIAVVVTAAMYASPLSIMRLVITTKSVEFMPFFLSLNVFLNGTAWTVYAIYVRDVYVAIPNAIGVLLGAAQLMLYAKYRGNTKSRGLKKNSSNLGISQQELIKGEETLADGGP